MKIGIIYSTNSGSCFLVAEQLKTLLGKKHTVTMQLAAKSTPNDFAKFDCVILGTPSWSVEGHEGYPHETMLTLLRSTKGQDFSNTHFALFGCGDNSYTYFCGAVDRVAEFVEAAQGKQIVEPLRIDSYFFDLVPNRARVDTWAQLLLTTLKKI